MTVSQQKLLKVFHVIASGLWLSCVIVLAALPIISISTASGDEVYMYNHAYHFIDMSILIPASIVTVSTGLCFSLFTKWGFVQHGWIIYKWIVTLFIVIAGTFYLGPMVTDLLEIANRERIEALQDPRYIQSQAIGTYAAIINASLLVVAVVVSVYKPWKNLRPSAKNRSSNGTGTPQIP